MSLVSKLARFLIVLKPVVKFPAKEEIEAEKKNLATEIARCNENIERFITEFNLNNEYEFFNTDKKIDIKDALKWIEENKKRDWFRNCRSSDLAMVIFWNNARNTYINRLVELVDAENAQEAA